MFLLLTACAPEPITSSPKRGGAEDSAEDERTDTGLLAGDQRPPVRAPCETEMDPAATLKLCGGFAHDAIGTALAAIQGVQPGEPPLLVGGGYSDVFLVRSDVGRGASYVDLPGVSHVRRPAPFDANFGNSLAGRVVGESAYIAVGSPNTWWYYDADGRAYLYEAETFGDPTASPIAAVSGGEQMLLGTAVAVLAGTGAGPGMVIGRSAWYGGSGIYQTAYIFWDTPGNNDDITGADLTLTSTDWYSMLGDWVGAADIDGDGIDEALLSHASGVVVVEAGLGGSIWYGDLLNVWTRTTTHTAAVGVADLTGDGHAELVLSLSTPYDVRFQLAVFPAPIHGDLGYDDAIGGYLLPEARGIDGARVAADVSASADISLAFGSRDDSGRRVFVHKGAIDGWFLPEDAIILEAVGEDEGLGERGLAILDLEGDGTREVAAEASDSGDFDNGAVYLFWDL